MRFNYRHLAILLLLVTLPALGETASLLILHTNDVHDHARAGKEGAGGLPYVSGYVKSIKAERPDVLLLDGGDVTEKGDMVSFMTDSMLTYEEMDHIGYDAIAVGNHEGKRGIEHVRDGQAHMPHTPLLCGNWLDDKGASAFPASKVFDVHGVKVAVIGMTLPTPAMPREETAKRLEQEAERLKPGSDIQVCLCHLGSKMAEELSEQAPEIDVFVTAHTHELLEKPKVAKKTGAIIVQAGMYAQHVGRLALTVDLKEKKITAFDGSVVEMGKKNGACDADLRDWVLAREKEICPEAARVVGRCAKPVQADDMARFAAEAMRQRAPADVAFCNTSQIMRNTLPKGDIDVNALFLTGGQRGHKLVAATLTGEQINRYLQTLLQEGRGLSQCAGFKITIIPSAKRSDWQATTDLTPDKNYRAIMPEVEWNARYVKTMKHQGPLPAIQPCDFSFTDAVTAYAETVTKTGKTIDAAARSLGATHTGAPTRKDDEN